MLEESYSDIDDENNIQVITTPFDPKKVDISVEQFTIEQMASRIEHDEIYLFPEFQRSKDLWDNRRMSQLIESILIKLPLPAFYFDVADDDEWIVVDGLQRLSTIQKFMVNKTLELNKLEFLEELNGKKFDDLDRSYQRRIRETNVTIFKIKKGTPKKVLTSLFHRINTGGLKLTAQEIRHALNQGKVSTFLNDIADSNWYKQCINVSPKRMLDKELIIRFMAFYRNGYKNYTPGLQQFLDNEMLYLNEDASDNELNDLKEEFKQSLELSKQVFGYGLFSKSWILNNPPIKDRNVITSGRYKGATVKIYQKTSVVINRSLLETTTVNFALLNSFEKNILLKNKKAFLEDYKELLKNNDFQNSITANTNHKDNVKLRHLEFQKIITKYTNHAY